MRSLALVSLLSLMACAGRSSTGGGEDGTETDGESETESSATASGDPADPCEGVTCGGAGICAIENGSPVCLCEDGTFDDQPPLDCAGGGVTASGTGDSATTGPGTSTTAGTSVGTTGSTDGGSSSGGSSSGGVTTGTTGGATSGGATTGGTGGSTTSGTGGSSTTTGGGLPDGDSCQDNGECQSGFCYGGGFGGPVCQPDCATGTFPFGDECDDDADCCQGTCIAEITGAYCG